MFERSTPHVNVGTIGNTADNPSGLATQHGQNADSNCFDNNVVNGVRNFHKPEVRVMRRTPHASSTRR